MNQFPRGLTEAEVLAQPASDIRSVLLRTFALEQLAHTDFGWDNTHPVLFQFLREVAPDAVKADVKVAQLPSPDRDVHERIAHLTHLLRHDPPELARFTYPGRTYLGVGVIFESWSRDTTPEEYVQLPNRSLADIPGSVEGRSLVGVLAGDHEFALQRVRGQEARICCSSFAPGTPGSGFSSAMALSGCLRALHQLLQRQYVGSFWGTRPSTGRP